MFSESKLEIELRAKTKAVNLRVRLKGALWGSPECQAQGVSGSVRARFRTYMLGVSVTLLQVLGRGQPQQQSVEVQYSLLLRLRKLWLRVRGKHRQDNSQETRVVKPAENRTLVKKKWRRSLSSVGKQLLLRKKSSEKVTMQKPVKESGYVAPYLDASGTDRVIRVLHGVGMVSTLIVLVQLVGSRGFSLLVTLVTGLAIVGRLVFANRYAVLDPGLQQLWYEAMSVGGISLLPQVLRAVFRPVLPQVGFIASGSILGTCTLVLILLARCGMLPFKALRTFGLLSAGIPAILILWAPIVQLWTCCWTPANVSFMQIFTCGSEQLNLGYPHRSLNQQQTPQCLHRQ